MEDKDRLGDKLHEKGKGDEDRFIAQQEREKLEKLREKMTAVHVRGTCPRDGATLVTKQEHGVPVDICPTCQGIWLDKGELQTILAREDEAWMTRWIRSVLEQK